MSSLNTTAQDPHPAIMHPLVDELLHTLNALEGHIIVSQNQWKSSSMIDFQRMHQVHEALHARYFNCLDRMDEIIESLPKKDLGIIHKAMGNFAQHLGIAQAKLAEEKKRTERNLQLYQKSVQKTNAYYNRLGKQGSVPVSSWKEHL